MRWSVVGLAALGAVSLAAVCLSNSTSTPAAPASRTGLELDASRQAMRLAAEPVLASASLGRFSARSDARRVAAVLARRIPLPTAGNFNGIRWETSGGALTANQIDAVLEYNAACQWLRALRDQRDVGVARRVLATVPMWPAFRSRSGDAAHLRAALREASAGGGPSATSMLSECDGAHQREAVYASHRRLPVSS